MQQQPIINMGSGRANQTASGDMFGQISTNAAPVTRYIHTTATYKSVQNVILTPANTQYPPCPQIIQPYQYSPQLPQLQQIYYPYVVQQPLQQQQQQHVTNSVDATINRAMVMHSEKFFSVSKSHGQRKQPSCGMTPVLAKTRLGVKTAKNVPVEVISTAKVPRQTVSQQGPSKNRKLRTHALEIIDPDTGRNVLDDLDLDKNISEPPDVLSKGPPIVHSPIESITDKDLLLFTENDAKSLSSSTSDKLCDEAPKLIIETKSDKLAGSNDQNSELLIYVKSNKSDSSIDEVPKLPISTNSNKSENSVDEAPKLPINITSNTSCSNIASGSLIKARSDKSESNTNEASELLINTNSVQSINSIDEAPKLLTNTKSDNSFCKIDETSEFLINAKTDVSASSMIDETPEPLMVSVQPIQQGSIQQTGENTVYSPKRNFKGKREEHMRLATDASTTNTAAGNGNSISKKFTKQPEPLNEDPPPQQPNIPMPNDDNSISRPEESQEEICTDKYYAASESEKSTVFNISESVKLEKLEKNESLKLNQQEQMNIVNSCNRKQETCKPKKTSNKIATETLSNEANKIDDNNNNENIANENKISAKITKLSTQAGAKLDYFKTHYTKQKYAVRNKTTASQHNKSSACSTKQPVKIKDNDTDEKDNVGPSSKDDDFHKSTVTGQDDVLATKQTIDSSCSSSTTSNAFEKSVEQQPTTAAATKKQQTVVGVIVAGRTEAKISYSECQWSPTNPSGKKEYSWRQLMQLSQVKSSRVRPNIKHFEIVSQVNLMPSFALPRAHAVGNTNKNSTSYQQRWNCPYLPHNRNNEKPIIHLSLALNQDVKLNEADNAWRPSVMAATTAEPTSAEIDLDQQAQREKETLLRRVRGILNKLTPEKFEPLVEEIISLQIDTMEKMEAVMILVFEKAIDEPNFSVSYASLCQRLTSIITARDDRETSNLAAFHRSLLDKAQYEFDQNVTQNRAKEENLLPIKEKLNSCTDANEKAELKALLDEEERKIRRRSGGTVRFIGELFKLSMLTGKIMYSCINALLKDPNNNDTLECLCKLLTTVGQKIEQTDIPNSNSKYSLNSIIQRMQNIATNKKDFKVSSRIRFMLQDVIDLRLQKWQSKRNETPKTMEQIEQEINKEKINATQYYDEGTASNWNDRAVRSVDKIYDDRNSQASDSVKRQQAETGSGGASSTSWCLRTGNGSRSSFVGTSKYY